MGRPKKVGLEYFPHDTDSTTDPKIEPTIMIYGAKAYAFYFMHLEYCYRSDDLCIDISTSEIGEEMREVIRRKLQITADEYNDILSSFLRHGAFDRETFRETGMLTSNGIKKRAEVVLRKRSKTKEYQGFQVSASETREETMPETPQRKEKKSIVKKSIGEQQPPIVPLGDVVDVDPEPEPEKPAGSKAIQFAHQAWGRPLSPLDAESIQSWCIDFGNRGSPEPDEIVIEALKISSSQNVRKMAYVSKILQSWLDDGVLRVSQIEDREKERRRSRQKEPEKQRQLSQTDFPTSIFIGPDG